MNNFSISVIIIALLSFLLSSCEKIEENTFNLFDIGEANMLPPENVKYLNHYRKVFNAKSDMSVRVQGVSRNCLTNYESNSNAFRYSIQGSFSEEIIKNPELNSIQVEDQIVGYNGEYGFTSYNEPHEYPDGVTPPYSQLFGKNVNVRFTIGSDDENRTTTTTDANFYVPEQLVLTSPLPVDVLDNFRISNSTLDIEWIPDTENEYGILVGISWKGGTLEKPVSLGANKKNIKLIDDDGQFTITSEFFEGIPHGAYIDFYIIRGNIQSVDVDGYIVEMSAISYLPQNYIVYE